MGLLYSELVQGIPPIFPHLIASVSSIHSVLVFVSIKAIPVSRVALEERFLFRHVEPREYRMFRCVVRHGYKDGLEDPIEFESQLIQNLKAFIQQESFMLTEGADVAESSDQMALKEAEAQVLQEGTKVRSANSSSRIIPNNNNQGIVSRASSDPIVHVAPNKSSTFSDPPIQGAEDEVKFIDKAMEKGVVYMLGEAEVVAQPNSSFLNKIVVNYAYSFLRKNFRQGDKLMAIPRKRLLKIGMTYEI
ncbi:potassium transporter 5-like [Arachis ipaensis]|nr:potassium transporter 5-like [Arachis ipaensis]